MYQITQNLLTEAIVCSRYGVWCDNERRASSVSMSFKRVLFHFSFHFIFAFLFRTFVSRACILLGGEPTLSLLDASGRGFRRRLFAQNLTANLMHQMKWNVWKCEIHFASCNNLSSLVIETVDLIMRRFRCVCQRFRKMWNAHAAFAIVAHTFIAIYTSTDNIRIFVRSSVVAVRFVNVSLRTALRFGAGKMCQTHEGRSKWAIHFEMDALTGTHVEWGVDEHQLLSRIIT